MTTPNFNVSIGQDNPHINESLQEIARILKTIKELENVTDHLEQINGASDAENMRSCMLNYHIQLTDELSSVVFKGMARCMSTI